MAEAPATQAAPACGIPAIGAARLLLAPFLPPRYTQTDSGRVAKDLFIDVHELERRKLEFDARYDPGQIDLPDNWAYEQALAIEGSAELLDRDGSRTIRVRGRLEARLQNECSRCLEPLSLELDGPVDLYFYPADTLEGGVETSISAQEVDIGFYEGSGLALSDAVQEQVSLWLPMRSLCREDCRGLCPVCGVNRNRQECSCGERVADPRWEALRSLEVAKKKKE